MREVLHERRPLCAKGEGGIFVKFRCCALLLRGVRGQGGRENQVNEESPYLVASNNTFMVNRTLPSPAATRSAWPVRLPVSPQSPGVSPVARMTASARMLADHFLPDYVR